MTHDWKPTGTHRKWNDTLTEVFYVCKQCGSEGHALRKNEEPGPEFPEECMNAMLKGRMIKFWSDCDEIVRRIVHEQ